MFPVATRTFSILSIIIFLLVLAGFTLPVSGQKPDPAKIEIAVRRSKDAADTLRAVAALPEGKGIPKDVTEKSNMIGVVPDAFQLSLLVSRGVRGHGVFSVRRENGWGLPVFYFYGGSRGFDPSKVGTKHFDIVFVFVNANISSEKKEKSKTGTKDKPEKVQLFLYSFANGILSPISNVENHALGFFKTPNVTYDDSLNKLVYGVKGDDVASGKATDPKPVASDVTAFRDALKALYPSK